MSRLVKQTRNAGVDFTTREENGELIIEGYFAVFNSVTELFPGGFEEIATGAFDKTLGNDIRALTNHDTSKVLGRNKAGTLTLTIDSRGLWGVIRINPKDTEAVNLYERVKRGDVDQCSFGFNILKEDVEFRDDGTAKWTILEIDLHEVSVVTFPAYADTGVKARMQERDNFRAKRLEERKRKIKERLNYAKTVNA